MSYHRGEHLPKNVAEQKRKNAKMEINGEKRAIIKQYRNAIEMEMRGMR